VKIDRKVVGSLFLPGGEAVLIELWLKARSSRDEVGGKDIELFGSIYVGVLRKRNVGFTPKNILTNQKSLFNATISTTTRSG
jgi:hypothetical protein